MHDGKVGDVGDVVAVVLFWVVLGCCYYWGILAVMVRAVFSCHVRRESGNWLSHMELE